MLLLLELWDTLQKNTLSLLTEVVDVVSNNATSNEQLEIAVKDITAIGSALGAAQIDGSFAENILTRLSSANYADDELHSMMLGLTGKMLFQ